MSSGTLKKKFTKSRSKPKFSFKKSNSSLKDDKIPIYTFSWDKPLINWTKQVRTGAIRRKSKEDENWHCLELFSNNPLTTFITTPVSHFDTLGITHTEFMIIGKSVGPRPFGFEIQILDDLNVRRLFHVSTQEKNPRKFNFTAYLPLQLTEGWNLISFDVAKYCKKLFGTQYMETIRVLIHANILLKEVYFQNAGKYFDTIMGKKRAAAAESDFEKSKSIRSSSKSRQSLGKKKSTATAMELLSDKKSMNLDQMKSALKENLVNRRPQETITVRWADSNENENNENEAVEVINPLPLPLSLTIIKSTNKVTKSPKNSLENGKKSSITIKPVDDYNFGPVQNILQANPPPRISFHPNLYVDFEDQTPVNSKGLWRNNLKKSLGIDLDNEGQKGQNLRVSSSRKISGSTTTLKKKKSAAGGKKLKSKSRTSLSKAKFQNRK